MMGEITLDKFLSFWVVLYSFGYILKIFPYNPIVLLGISIIVFSVAAVIIALYYHNKNSNLFSVLIVLIYILYIKAVDDDILCVYRDLFLFIINKEEGREGPLYKYYKNITV